MDDIIRKLVQQLGLSEETARKAVELILGQLEEKLPEPIAGHLEGIMNGDVKIEDLVNDESLLGKLGGLFGGKK